MDEREFMGLLAKADEGETAVVLKAVDQQPAIVNQSGNNGWLLLHPASLSGRLELVQGLIDRKADIHAKDSSGNDALMSSAYRGHIDVAALLLKSGANASTTAKSGYSAVGLAAMNAKFDLCELLLKGGADLMEGRVKEGQATQTAAELYGKSSHPAIGDDEKAERCSALCAIFANGPHPSQIQRRREEEQA